MRVLRVGEPVEPEGGGSYLGKFFDRSHYDTVVQGESTRVLRPDGSQLIVLLKDAVPLDACRVAYANLRDAAALTTNRSTAAGPVEYLHNKVRHSHATVRRIKKDGSVSRTNHAGVSVRSGIVGAFDGTSARYPYCRLTSYTAQHMGRFRACGPYFSAVARAFEEGAPERYAAQMEAVAATHPAWIIEDTPWTTVTVNRNFRTAGHRDAGDLAEGFGCLTVHKRGKFTGGLLVFPAYRIAVDWEEGDVLLADVHEVHGNTEFKGTPGKFERLTCVFYFRAKMVHCDSPEAEIARAKRRKAGDPILRKDDGGQ